MPTPVLHVCDKFGVAGSSIHGVSRLFSWWLPRYDPARFEIHLCGLKAKEPASQLLEENGIRVSHLGRGRFDPRIVTDLAGLARRLGARILHVHGYAAADFGRLAAPLVGAKLVLHEHFADPKMPRYQAVADWTLRGLTDRAIAVSASTKDFLVKERFVPSDRVRIIFNGAPLKEFEEAPPEVARKLREELGIPGRAQVVGSVGRLSLQKGHRYLLEAAQAVVGAKGDVLFLVVGDGDQEAALREQAERLGIARRVLFAGHRSDVRSVLAAMDVFCISSTYEGTPLALFEAMAAGKPIVSTAVDGCKEVIEEGKTGLLVPPRDPQALAGVLLRLLSDPVLKESLSRGAKASSAAYDISECVVKMEALYDEVLETRPSS